MSRINVLDIDTVNKIAAGEVVERPAAAVKELIENSIDAKADKITVEIQNGGISYIRVTDNGAGIPKDEVEKAFLPHSTSKITSIEDLTSLYTMGFRGEALASISSVARVDIITKFEEEDIGTAMSLEGGKIVSKSEAGSPQGTTIIVKDLFYNTPARMNFMKKDSTEAAHIKEVVERMILGYPEISFKFISNGRELLFSTGNSNLNDAFSAVYTNELSSQMTEVDYTKDNIRVYGLIGLPHTSRPNRNMQNFFVNKRWVKSKTIVHGAEEAYKTMLMVGKYPILLLNIELSSGLTDVNVHPAKLEIKFQDESKIHSAVYWAVKNAIFSTEKEKEVAKVQSTFKETPKAEPIKVNPFAFKPKEEVKDFFSEQMIELFSNKQETENIAVFNTTENTQIEYDVKEPDSIDKDYKIIGQLFDTYILVEREDKLLLIDQHAAHERINYEKISAEKKVVSQTLMFPESLTLSSVEADVLNSNMNMFEELGFEIEQFGGNDFIVRQAPCDIKTEEINNTVIQITQLLKDNKDPSEVFDKALFTIACKSSIKANMSMSESELAFLVEKALFDDKVRTCPHGRPIVISFNRKYIEKEFKRIV